MRRTVHASLAVVPLVGVALFLGSSGPTESPLSATLRVLPPMGSARIEPARDALLDDSLTDLLRVTICRQNRFGGCEPEAVFTSTSGSKKKDAIRLQGRRYRVVWKPDARRGSYEIHFDVAGLAIGFIEYEARTPRAVPLAFTIDRHPRIRGRALHEAGFSTKQCVVALNEEFGLDPSQMLHILSQEEYPLDEIASALRDVFGSTLEEIAWILSWAGHGALDVAAILQAVFSATADQIALVLKEVFAATALDAAVVLEELGFDGIETGWALHVVYGFEGDALGLAQTLREAGYGSAEVYEMLAEIFELDISDGLAVLVAAGYTEEEALGAVRVGLARRFAPQLRFHSGARHFPMSAEVYFKEVIESGYFMNPTCNGSRCEQPHALTGNWSGYQDPHMSNQDPSTLADPKKNNVPMYFKMHSCGEQIRIVYWWFIGHQDECGSAWVYLVDDKFANSNHHGDWERVMVILSEDATQVAAVVYNQHGGHYTRLGGGSGGAELLDDTHPVVYAGELTAGSYYNTGRKGQLAACYYYGDKRGDAYRLDGWKNLVSLHPTGNHYAESWMEAEQHPEDPEKAPECWRDGCEQNPNCNRSVPTKRSECGDWTPCEKREDLCGRWGYNVFFKVGAGHEDRNLGAINTHPTIEPKFDNCSLEACEGWDSGVLGQAGCHDSQCQRGDRSDSVTRCYHCGTDNEMPPPHGEWCTDTGLTCHCAIGDDPPIDWYRFDYVIPQIDRGLVYKDWTHDACGIGPELALALPVLWWLRRRRDALAA